MIPFRSLVPIASVKNVTESIRFYTKIGFEVGNTFTPNNENEPAWAWLKSDSAQLMISRGEVPSVQEQSVIFYLYCDDVPAKRAELESLGLDVGPIEYPFYAPKGEFRVTDPDGYILMITHT